MQPELVSPRNHAIDIAIGNRLQNVVCIISDLKLINKRVENVAKCACGSAVFELSPTKYSGAAAQSSVGD